MSGTVDTRTVEMRFDNSDFESNVKQSMSTLEKLKKALKLDGASTGLKEVEKASRKLDFRDFKGSIDSVGKRFSVLETIATGALLKIGASAAEAGMRIAKSLTIDQIAAGWDKYAEKTTAVQTIMANLRDGESQFIDEASKMDYVNGYLNKLLWFSDETSYSFTEMTNNVGKFIANGQGLSESVTAMQGIATWAAVSGQNTQVAARAMYNISQAMGTGSMKIKDWMSIENANMATAQFKELAITIGQKQGKIKEGQVTVEGFRESLSGKDTNGWFDKDVMMEVFETYGEAANRIQEYAEAHNVTSTEAIREIKKVDKDFADSLGFKAFAAAQEAKTFSDVVSATADAVSTKWMQIFENVFGNYLEAKELWTNLAEDMWEIFAAPLDTINSIMTSWNQGFTEGGPLTPLQKLYESGMMDKLESSLNHVSKGAAELAVNSDKAHYKIETLADGSKQLVKLVEETPGVYTRFTKKIYEGDKDLLSGREMLIDGFRNILQTLFLGYDAEDGTHITSVLGAIKESILEVIFGTSDLEEVIPKVARKLWDFTKRFRDFTAKLKPSAETTEKIKNSFKGLFTLFKIGGKFIGAIFKPFKELFGKVFKDAPKNILDLADSIGTWIQKLDKFFNENKVFEKVSQKIKSGLNTITVALDTLSMRITGKSLADLGKELKNKIFGFFEDYDFQAKIDSVKTFYNDIVEQIRQVKTGDLPETLTPFQKFLIVGQKIFEGLKSFFGFIKSIFTGVWGSVKTLIDTKDFGAFFGALGKTFSSVVSEFKNSEVIVKVFNGLRTVFSFLTDILSGLFKNTSLIGLLGTAGKIGIAGLIVSFLNSIIAIWSVSRKVGWVLDGIYEVLNGVGKFLRAKSFQSIAEGAKALGIALLLMSVAVGILGNMDIKTMAKGFVAIGLMIGIFWLFKKLMSGVSGLSTASAAAGLLAFSVGIGLLGVVAFALGAIDTTKLYKGMAAILVLTAIFGLFSHMTKQIRGIKLAAASVSFGLFAIAVGLLSASVAILGSMSASSLLKGAAAITALVLIFALFKKLTNISIGLIGSTVAFGLFAIAVDILAIGVKALGNLEWRQIAKATVAIGAMVVIFGLLRLLSTLALGLIGSTVAFGLFAIAVDILAIGVKALGNLGWGQIAKATIAIGALVVIFGLLRLLSTLAIGLLGATVTFGLFAIAVDILAIGVKSLGQLDAISLAGAVAAIASLILIFDMFSKLSAANAVAFGSVATFGLFAIAVDILAIGVKALGQLDLGQLTKGILAVGAIVLLYGLFRALSATAIGAGSIGGFLAFSAAIYVVSAAFNALIPVMQQIDSMGDGWWKPLVFLAAAIGLVVAAGAISGLAPVAAGLMVLSAAVLAIGAACLLAGVGIGIAAAGLALLASVIADKGPEAAKNFATFISVMLDTVISSVPKMAEAAAALITAFALGVGKAAGALVASAIIVVLAFIEGALQALIAAIPVLVTGIVSAIDAMADAIRMAAPLLTQAMMGLVESLVEAVLTGIATIVEPWGAIGSAIANKIMKWIPGLREAFGVAAGEAGEEAAESYMDGFSGGGAGKSFGEEPKKEITADDILNNIPGISAGSSDLSSLLPEGLFDADALQSLLGDSFAGLDFTSLMDGKMGDLASSIESSTPDVEAASKETASVIETPIKNLDAISWGTEIGSNLASGLRSEIPNVDSAAFDLAAAVAKYIHFSEPDVGPLSDFHTYAPDMIRLWCKGVKDNLGMVEDSSYGVADTVYDGFSTALDYVSDLIDDGMSDQLTIRPVMDLTEIQNGMNSMSSMLSNKQHYTVTGTSRLAAAAAYGMTRGTLESPAPIASQTDFGSTTNNFYVNNPNPDAVADRISKILGNQTKRQRAAFNRK